jgi:hypothetical protein
MTVMVGSISIVCGKTDMGSMSIVGAKGNLGTVRSEGLAVFLLGSTVKDTITKVVKSLKTKTNSLKDFCFVIAPFGKAVIPGGHSGD